VFGGEGGVKLALIYDGYGPQGWPVHGPFDAANLWDSPVGVSGTELQLFGHALELARLGHSVSVYSRFAAPWVYPPLLSGSSPAFRDLDESAVRRACDVAIAYHDARRLEDWPAKLKVALHQTFLVANKQQDATYTGADFADIYITASERVAAHLRKAYGWPDVRVVPNAWDLGTYQPWRPVAGRIIYTTSLERGFHRLLEAFPLIKERVPGAHIVAFERGGPAVENLKANPVEGVTLIRASSRNAVLAEIAKASVYAYPSDVSAPTECFPVSLLEACATGCPVVLSPDDGIEELFGSGVMLSSSVKQNPEYWRDDFVGRVCAMLTDSTLAHHWSDRGRAFAEPFRFDKTTRLLAEIVGIS
jgi:glycosyltransferase involved in cell wall biosynthesis